MRQTNWDVVDGGIFKKAVDYAYKTSQTQCGFLLVSLTTKENQRKSNLHGKWDGKIAAACEEGAGESSEALK